MKKNSFAYNEKIRLKRDFTRLFTCNTKVSSKIFLVYFCPNGLEFNRIAISIKKSVAIAAKRNRMKRLVREIFRLHKSEIFDLEKKDILVIAKKDFSDLKMSGIQEELLSLWKR